MKATFFSVFALAMFAIASPVPQGEKASRSVEQVGGAVHNAENIVTSLGVKQIVDEATKSPVKRAAISNPQELITTIKTTVHKVNMKTTGISTLQLNFQDL